MTAQVQAVLDLGAIFPSIAASVDFTVMICSLERDLGYGTNVIEGGDGTDTDIGG